MTSVTTNRRVGRYEIMREVGRGGTAVVYLARQADLDRFVALKELAAFHAADPAFIERFFRESRIAGSLNHPNIVTVHEYFEHEGTPFIAMEYFERGSLRDVKSSLTLPQVAGVLECILAGLAHAHAREVVHRDLKPENVMVTSSGGLKITDFGVAKVVEGGGSRLTESGATVGTPAYMAPEQALGTGVGPATDLYAVGVLAYEMLSGTVPFHGSDIAMAIMLQHINEPVPSLRAAWPDLDPQLCAWVERMLAKAPEDRPASASDAWDDLDEIVIAFAGPRWRRESRLTVDAFPAERAADSVPTRGLRPTWTLPRRRRVAAVAGLAAASIAALAAGGALAVALSRDEVEAPATQAVRTTADSGATTTVARPEPRALVRRVAFSGVDPVLATIGLTGPMLKPRRIAIGDRDISDGRAWFEIRQAGIGATTRGAESGDAAVRVRKAKDRVRVDVRTVATFDRIAVRRVDGHTVLVTLTRPQHAPQSGPSTRGTPGDTTPTQDTTPPPKSEDPPAGPWPNG